MGDIWPVPEYEYGDRVYYYYERSPWVPCPCPECNNVRVAERSIVAAPPETDPFPERKIVLPA